MIIKFRKQGVEKVVQVEGYTRTRFAYRDATNESKELGLDEPTTIDWDGAFSTFDFMGAHPFGAIVVPEKAGNRVFIMNDDGDTIDRLSW